MRLSRLLTASAAVLAAAGAAPPALALSLNVSLTNTSPAGGVGLSPLWLGFHNGGFDVFSPGTAASAGVEQTAEDGANAAITALFAASVPGGVQGTLPGAPAFPGDLRSATFDVDTTGSGRYFSYLSMVVVSNDFFVANATPTAIDLAALQPGQTLTILAGRPFAPGRENIVYEAGTEVDDFQFSLANGAFGIPGGQTGGNQGTPQNGVITAVQGDPFAGFLNAPMGFVSGALNFNDASLYQSVGRITITAVPEPASLAVLSGALGILGAAGWRRRVCGAEAAI